MKIRIGMWSTTAMKKPSPAKLRPVMAAVRRHDMSAASRQYIVVPMEGVCASTASRPLLPSRAYTTRHTPRASGMSGRLTTVPSASSVSESRSPPSNPTTPVDPATPSNPTTPTNPTAPTGSVYYLKNHWSGAYLGAEGGRAKYDAAIAGAAYEWVMEDQSGFKRFKSVGGNCYLNIENQAAYVECGNVPATYYSGLWSLESVSGYARLKNAWKGTYLNVESQSGYAQSTAVPDFFESGQWSLVKK